MHIYFTKTTVKNNVRHEKNTRMVRHVSYCDEILRSFWDEFRSKAGIALICFCILYRGTEQLLCNEVIFFIIIIISPFWFIVELITKSFDTVPVSLLIQRVGGLVCVKGTIGQDTLD